MTSPFITFEGVEGSGKSTQVKLLCEKLGQAAIAYVATREPGGSKGAEAIRNLVVAADAPSWDPVAETLLFYAARLDHVNTLIKPALAEKKLVLCDRFADSTRVYQGIAKQVSDAYIQELHRLTLGNFAPTLTLIFDIDPNEGLKRAQSRHGNETRFESLGLEFHQKIRAGFLSIAQAEPQRCVVINAAQSVEQVHSDVIAALSKQLGLKL